MNRERCGGEIETIYEENTRSKPTTEVATPRTENGVKARSKRDTKSKAATIQQQAATTSRRARQGAVRPKTPVVATTERQPVRIGDVQGAVTKEEP